MKKLILTGWGWLDYACAAALALRHHLDAEVMGMSTRRLPEFLNEVTGYREIIILGVGLTGNVELLGEALAKLAKRGIRVSWISALEAPESVGEEIRSQIDIFVGGDGEITSAVAACYGIAHDDLSALLETRGYSQLLEAAMYAYRNYQDEKAYGSAIRHLADGDPESKWLETEKQLVEHFKRYGNREIVGSSEATGELLRKINLVAPRANARVLIFGESGTGKETVALQIHNKSPRRNEPFIAFNCASVTPNLLESRFLGHEKGAFTGATEVKRGIFEQASGGTLFLDEIGELPLEAQGILLRVLQGGRFTRIGEREEVEVDVRLIAATNRNLPAMVREGRFREDLFHRLNVIQIRVPPLREHKDDIGRISNCYWLKQHRRRLEPSQVEALKTYDYPGNVRELFNLLERADVLGETDFNRLLKEHRMMTEGLAAAPSYDYPDDLESMTRLHVRRVYEKCDGNLTRAAEALNAARNTVKKYLEK